MSQGRSIRGENARLGLEVRRLTKEKHKFCFPFPGLWGVGYCDLFSQHDFLPQVFLVANLHSFHCISTLLTGCLTQSHTQAGAGLGPRPSVLVQGCSLRLPFLSGQWQNNTYQSRSCAVLPSLAAAKRNSSIFLCSVLSTAEDVWQVDIIL